MGSFSIKSEYWMLRDRSWNPRDVTWKNDWKFKALKKFVSLYGFSLNNGYSLMWNERGKVLDMIALVILVSQSSNLFSDDLHEWLASTIQNPLRQTIGEGSLDGLVILQGYGYERVTIQGDCLEMVKVLQDTPPAASGSALIRHIQKLLMHAGH
ncbi:hypothetical protein Gotri_012466 [Gossypium trilobum]|uniref:RNase H type-1 domain-containing protein n=1 Tax=Gossypium trilobum TaxID=34281 RepID=A0A7J9DQG3_9ROSI|nr:hypothetical protein [Gossypium trilobum]